MCSGLWLYVGVKCALFLMLRKNDITFLHMKSLFACIYSTSEVQVDKCMCSPGHPPVPAVPSLYSVGHRVSHWH